MPWLVVTVVSVVVFNLVAESCTPCSTLAPAWRDGRARPAGRPRPPPPPAPPLRDVWSTDTAPDVRSGSTTGRPGGCPASRRLHQPVGAAAQALDDRRQVRGTPLGEGDEVGDASRAEPLDVVDHGPASPSITNGESRISSAGR